MRKQLKLTVVLFMGAMSVFLGYIGANGVRDLTFVNARYKPYIIEFIKEMDAEGIKIPKQQRWTIEEDMLLYNAGLNGIAVGMNDDRQVNIRLSPRLRWVDKNAVRFTIWHELAHDLYNVKHGEGLLMKTTASSNDSELFIIAKIEFIQMMKKKQAK
jgi:hypothetical protein